MSKHTPEPWKTYHYLEKDLGDGWCIVPENKNSRLLHSVADIPRIMPFPDEDGRPTMEGIAEENAGRIVAAVNACAGIPTEALEQGIVESLIKILEVFTNAVVALPHDLRPITYSICDAREIIAKARGK